MRRFVSYGIIFAITALLILVGIVLTQLFIQWDFEAWRNINWYSVRVSMTLGLCFMVWQWCKKP